MWGVGGYVVHTQTRNQVSCPEDSEDYYLSESVHDYVGPGDQTQIGRLGGKPLCPLSHLASPQEKTLLSHLAS